MNGKYEKFLPIGSVVLLKGGKVRVMITGYATIDMNQKDKVFDYCGCVYPVGVIDSKQNLLFNHEDIERIFAIGFSDEEQKTFIKNFKESFTDENIKTTTKTKTTNKNSYPIITSLFPLILLYY